MKTIRRVGVSLAFGAVIGIWAYAGMKSRETPEQINRQVEKCAVHLTNMAFDVVPIPEDCNQFSGDFPAVMRPAGPANPDNGARKIYYQQPTRSDFEHSNLMTTEDIVFWEDQGRDIPPAAAILASAVAYLSFKSQKEKEQEFLQWAEQQMFGDEMPHEG